MDSFKSDKVVVKHSIDKVYGVLSNPESLNLADQLPPEAREKMEKVSFDNDSITIKADPVGEITLRIKQLIAPTKIVFEAERTPVPMNAIITMNSLGDNETEIVAELALELNPFLRTMVAKPLKDGAAKFGELLAGLPYDRF